MDSELQHLKQRIAQVYARREALKRDLEAGGPGLRESLRVLDDTDRELSALDTRFKQLWDARPRTDFSKEQS